jgi:hypothetical protein
MITFPKINQLRFHHGEYLDGGSANHDNRSADAKIWTGVYPHRFYQPILKVWPGSVGDGNELDFLIRTDQDDWALESKAAKIYQILTFDKYGELDTIAEIAELTPTDFFTYSNGDHMMRFTASFASYGDGFYFIRIEDSGVAYDLYDSNIFQVMDTAELEECYPFAATNFENDFGVIWENTTPTVWYLKLFIPYRMYKPMPKMEKSTYVTDAGVNSTLRTTINRGYELETLPIPIWYAELLQIVTGLSDIYINNIQVHFEDMPTMEIISESNLCVLKGVCFEVAFNDKYTLNV